MPRQTGAERMHSSVAELKGTVWLKMMRLDLQNKRENTKSRRWLRQNTFVNKRLERWL